MVRENPPLFQKVDCIRFYVDDLDAGLKFYRDELGHHLIWRTADALGLRMSGTDTELVLHTEPRPPEIDLLVESADDAAARVEAAGGHMIVSPFDIPVGRCAVVADPWGNEFVLLDLRKGHFVTDENSWVVGVQNPADDAG